MKPTKKVKSGDDEIIDRLTKVAKEVNVDSTVLINEYKSLVAQSVAEGVPEGKAKNVAFVKVVGSYRRLLKSNTLTFKGFFFAVEPKKNAVGYIRKLANDRVEMLKKMFGEDKWKIEAIGGGIINEKGEFLYNKTNSNWPSMYGKVIPKAVWKKTAYGFFEMPETGEIKYCRVFVDDPDNFYPELLRVYTFRAKCKNLDAESPNITAVAGITTLNPTDEVVTYADFETYVKEYLSDNFMSLSDVVSGNEVLDGRQNIVLSEVIINDVFIPDNEEYCFIHFSDINNIDAEEGISIGGDVYYAKKIVNQSVGIIIYSVYQAGDKVKGRVFGFIPDPAFSKPEDDFEIAEDVNIDVEEDEFS